MQCCAVLRLRDLQRTPKHADREERTQRAQTHTHSTRPSQRLTAETKTLSTSIIAIAILLQRLYTVISTLTQPTLHLNLII